MISPVSRFPQPSELNPEFFAHSDKLVKEFIQSVILEILFSGNPKAAILDATNCIAYSL